MTLEPTDPPVNLPDDGGESSDGEGAAENKPRKPVSKGGGAITVLSAAMLAVGDILEPEKTTVEIVQTDDDPIDDLPFNIDFGDLPPLG